MPTGYTAELYEGKPQTFEEFVWNCARAFGALVMLRDEGPDAKIDIDEVSSEGEYATTRLAELKKELRALESMTLEEAAAQADAYYAKLEADHAESVTRAEELAARYDAMLAQVEAWKPPTQKHTGLKAFMLKQLKESREHDCSVYALPAKPTGAKWRRERIESLKRSLEYNRESVVEQKKRVNERREWLLKLKESVPLPPKFQP